MKLFLFPLALKFCESMNVATVVSFLYISSVPEIKGKCATFSGLHLRGRCIFPQSLLLWGYGPSFAQEFLFCFCFTLQKSKERCRISWNKTKFLPYRYFTKWIFH